MVSRPGVAVSGPGRAMRDSRGPTGVPLHRSPCRRRRLLLPSNPLRDAALGLGEGSLLHIAGQECTGHCGGTRPSPPGGRWCPCQGHPTATAGPTAAARLTEPLPGPGPLAGAPARGCPHAPLKHPAPIVYVLWEPQAVILPPAAPITVTPTLLLLQPTALRRGALAAVSVIVLPLPTVHVAVHDTIVCVCAVDALWVLLIAVYRHAAHGGRGQLLQSCPLLPSGRVALGIGIGVVPAASIAMAQAVTARSTAPPAWSH